MSTNRYLIDEARALLDAQEGAFDGPDWLRDARDAARGEAAAQGLPSTRVEDWKYSDLRKALNAETTPSVDLFSAVDAIDLTGGDLPEGLQVQALADADADTIGALWQAGADDLDPLNRALANQGVVVTITSSFNDARPLRLALGAGHSRHLIRVEEGAQATVIEQASGDALGQHVVRIEVAEGAKLLHLRARTGGATLLERHDVTLASKATYDATSLFTGGAFTRAETQVTLNGEEAHCELRGAYLLKDKSHLDIRTVMTHAAPNAYSNQLFKGVLNDQARTIYQGRVSVARGADGTAAHQLSKAVLMSNRAEIDHKPELEIFADDVECSHGATAGALDAEALFYLQSRGVPRDQARALLIAAFVQEVMEGVENEALAGILSDHAHKAFDDLTGGGA